jgi:dihydrodipicolinate synthase/N-acetylneuraminate lyase
MRNVRKYHGVVVPMVTPFTEKGLLDRESCLKLVDFLVEEGTFPFILGTTGEAASIPVNMRDEFVKLVGAHLNGKTILYAGIADNCHNHSVEMSKRFYDWGVNAFVAHSPCYYPIKDEDLLKYFEILADNIPGPLIIYNIPSTTHISISIGVIEKLSHHPNIVGLKDSERSLERVEILTEMFADRNDFSLLSGWTFQSARVLLAGFDGIVPSTANYVPGLFRELFQAALSDAGLASRLQEKINPIAEIHQKDRMLSEVIAALKIMLSRKGLCQPYLLPPLQRLSQAEEKQILENLEKVEASLIEQ